MLKPGAAAHSGSADPSQTSSAPVSSILAQPPMLGSLQSRYRQPPQPVSIGWPLPFLKVKKNHFPEKRNQLKERKTKERRNLKER